LRSARRRKHRGFGRQRRGQARGESRRETVRAAQLIADHVIAHPRLHRAIGFEPLATALELDVVELTVHQARNVLVHHHLRFSSVPSCGRSSAAIASRARKIRERTVPIGQFITDAISS
jgi:hypothetical protein